MRRPFTRADAIAAGIDPRLLRGSRFRRIFKGVHVSADRPPSPLLQAEACLLVHPPTAFVSHLTAARVYEVPVPDHAQEHVSVFDGQDRRRRKEISCHVVSRDARVGRHQGIRISMPDRMFVELASMLSLLDLVIVGDNLVRRKWLTPQHLVEHCRASTDPFARTALHAAEYVREGVDSPMETRLRMLIVLAGLPEPEVNHLVFDEAGRLVRRFDLCYPGLNLLIEYDGRQHAEDPDQWHSDIYRREDLDRWGWRLVVVTHRGIYHRPGETLLRIRRAMKERGARGLPARFSEKWRAHFPVRQQLTRSS